MLLIYVDDDTNCNKSLMLNERAIRRYMFLTNLFSYIGFFTALCNLIVIINNAVQTNNCSVAAIITIECMIILELNQGVDNKYVGKTANDKIQKINFDKYGIIASLAVIDSIHNPIMANINQPLY